MRTVFGIDVTKASSEVAILVNGDKTYLQLLKAFRIEYMGCFFCFPQIFVIR